MNNYELRIGSLVQAKSPEMSEYQSPVVLNEGYFEMLLNSKIDIRPILLNERLLLQSGCEKTTLKHKDKSTSEGYMIGSFFICRGCDEYEFIVSKVSGNNSFINDIKCHYIASVYHYHRWQNLYFALTGEELQLKEGE